MELHLELKVAMRQCNIDRVNALLATDAGANLLSEESAASSLMYEATMYGFIQGLDSLKSAGVDVNICKADRFTPLMNAAVWDQEKTGRWLLRNGADPCIENQDMQTALSVALTNDHLSFANMMLEESASLNKRSIIKSAKRVICFRNLSVAHWLLRAGVDPNIRDNDGTPWLIIAQSKVEENSKTLTELLLKAGAHVNCQAHDGITALHKAFLNQAEAPFISLLQAGADPDLADFEGDSVRDLLKTDALGDLRAAFVAWESSRKAHQAISGPVPKTLRPL